MARHTYPCVVALVAITWGCWPTRAALNRAIDARHVFFCGWLTALSTGLGALPFLVLPNVDWKSWASYANCVAAGMMIAASVELVLEGLESGGAARAALSPSGFPGAERTLLGALSAARWCTASSTCSARRRTRRRCSGCST